MRRLSEPMPIPAPGPFKPFKCQRWPSRGPPSLPSPPFGLGGPRRHFHLTAHFLCCGVCGLLASVPVGAPPVDTSGRGSGVPVRGRARSCVPALRSVIRQPQRPLCRYLHPLSVCSPCLTSLKESVSSKKIRGMRMAIRGHLKQMEADVTCSTNGTAAAHLYHGARPSACPWRHKSVQAPSCAFELCHHHAPPP